MNAKEKNRQELDNLLIIKSKQDINEPEKPINEEVNLGYNSADDTGNTNEDLDLNPDDDINTNIDKSDLEALNGQDLDEN